MNIITTGVIKPPVKEGYCTLQENGDFYLLRFGFELQQAIERAAANGMKIIITGTGHTFKNNRCGKHHFFIKAISVD